MANGMQCSIEQPPEPPRAGKVDVDRKMGFLRLKSILLHENADKRNSLEITVRSDERRSPSQSQPNPRMIQTGQLEIMSLPIDAAGHMASMTKMSSKITSPSHFGKMASKSPK
jgi:hypothetical protein